MEECHHAAKSKASIEVATKTMQKRKRKMQNAKIEG